MNENENVNNEEIGKASISSNNSQELFNLIQSIQSKMTTTNTDDNNNNSNFDKENSNNDNFNSSNNNNLNELLDNVLSSTQNINTINNNKSNTMDFSSIFSLLQNLDLSSVIGLFSNKSTDNNSSINENNNFNINNNESIFNGIDPGTILKFQRILTSMNKNDPKKNLLLSLKPFLRKSRQDKLNEYVTMLTIANAIGIFGSKGSDDNV